MSRKTCSVCHHPDAAQLNELLVAGAGVREVAARYGFGKSTIFSHKQRCIKPMFKTATGTEQGDNLLREVRVLQRAVSAILSHGLKSGDASLVLQSVREARQNISLMGQLLGKIGPSRPTVNAVAVNVNLPAATARRMASVYLERHPELKEGSNGRSE